MDNPFEAMDQKLMVIEQKLEKLLRKLDDPESDSQKWLTSKQLAEYLSISASSVSKLRGSKVPYYKLGGKVYFKKQEIDKWIEKTRHKSSGEYLDEYLGLK